MVWTRLYRGDKIPSGDNTDDSVANSSGEFLTSNGDVMLPACYCLRVNNKYNLCSVALAHYIFGIRVQVSIE